MGDTMGLRKEMVRLRKQIRKRKEIWRNQRGK